MTEDQAANPTAGDGKRIDILVLLPGDVDKWASTGCRKYVLPLDRAKGKILRLLESVAEGEVEYFAVSLHE